MLIKKACSFLKIQLCTVALSLTLFNSARLPREAARFGAVPYLVVYSLWLVVIGLGTALLQLATGQLSQQDAVGVLRAVPILRGLGHLKLLTSYLTCIYNMLYVALASAYMIWIAKDTFPLKACTRLQMTPNGYENKMNATECFNATFLSSFTLHPQYYGILVIIVFVLWFFVPLLLYALGKSFKVTLSIIAPILVALVVVLTTFLAKTTTLETMLVPCKQWMVFAEPFIWFSAMVQALMSTQILSGFLTSAGGTIYEHSDVRWVSTSIIMYNLLAGWLFVLFWQSTLGLDRMDEGFLAVLVWIYQVSFVEMRIKLWPLLGYTVLFISGLITILTLLYPIYDRFQRLTGDKWKLVACASSALGTALTMAVLAKGMELATVLDELVVPVLVVFSTAMEVVGFVFIYGCQLLRIDIRFLTGIKVPCIWMVFWWMTPALLLGVTGWWLRALLRDTWGQPQTLWPLGGVFIGILVVMSIMAAVAVAKEEQFNLLSKIAAAFKPSRLWGPEDPSVRFNWMEQRYAYDQNSNENDSTGSISYPQTISNKKNGFLYNDWPRDSETYQRAYNLSSNIDDPTVIIPKYNDSIYNTYSLPRAKKEDLDKKFVSPNVCLATNEFETRQDCSCNRHFTLNVPQLKRSEITTCL